MKRLHLALVFLFFVLLSPLLSAQSGQQPPISQKTLSTTTCTVPSSAGCLIVGTSGSGGLGIQVTGSFSGTLSFYGSVDGTNYVAITGLPVASTTPVTSVTAPGAWVVGVGGLSYIKVAFSAYMSGTAVVSTRTAITTARTGVGGSSAGTIVGADTRVLFFDGANNPAGDAGLTYNKTTDILSPGGISAGALYAAISLVNPVVAIGGNDTSGAGAVLVLASDSNDSSTPGMLVYSSQGTIASPEVSGATNSLFDLQAYGYDGSGFQISSSIGFKVNGSPSAGNVPGIINFSAAGAGASDVRAYISALGFTLANGLALQSDTTTAHTAVLQAYDVDGTAYKTFATLTNGNTPDFTIAPPSGGTVNVQGVYKSNDGTAGVTTTCTLLSITAITVKNGLITGCS